MDIGRADDHFGRDVAMHALLDSADETAHTRSRPVHLPISRHQRLSHHYTQSNLRRKRRPRIPRPPAEFNFGISAASAFALSKCYEAMLAASATTRARSCAWNRTF